MLRPEDNSTPSPKSRWLVSTDWLAEHLNDRNVIAVDSSYFLPDQPRDAHAEYRNGHIPGAVFFDIDKIADDSSDLPHTLPGPAHFGEAVGALGIGDGDTVVIYDSAGLFSAARVWWTFRIFGAKKVFILDGGLPKWKAEESSTGKGRCQAAGEKIQCRDECRGGGNAVRHAHGRRPTMTSRSLTRAQPAASPEKSLNRDPACAQVTCRAH